MKYGRLEGGHENSIHFHFHFHPLCNDQSVLLQYNWHMYVFVCYGHARNERNEKDRGSIKIDTRKHETQEYGKNWLSWDRNW